MKHGKENKMEENTTATFLPNPDGVYFTKDVLITRLPIVDKCKGCHKVFENHALPEGQILVDVCICYENPEIKWKSYRVEVGKKMKSGKEVEALYHYNPCPMATHIKHSPKVEEVRGKLNPIKHSKRK
jgi:hypothetical protein